MGNAEYGGAVYASGKLNLTITDTRFLYNRADKRGGAIYLGNLKDGYLVEILKEMRFESNVAKEGGDNLYAGETENLVG